MNASDLRQQNLLDEELAAALRGDFETAEDILVQLSKVYPDDLAIRFNYGWFVIRNGDFQKGYEMLEAGRDLKCYGNGHIPTKKPIWNPRFHLLKGKRIVLALEGGYGDEIIAARFAQRLYELGGKVVLMGHPDLHGLLKSIPNVERVVSVLDISGMEFDYWMPGFSAGWVSGYTHETLYNAPYIRPDPALVDKWKGIIGEGGLKIGLRWGGNPKFEHEQYRKFDADLMIRLADDRARFFSLQRDADLVALPSSVVDLKEKLTSWDETAAAIENLDLVISSCTSVAHLAAAMGKKTWIVVPVLAYHCWALPGTTSPWYPSVTLFRQKIFGDWRVPFKDMRHSLDELIHQQGGQKLWTSQKRRL